MNHSLTKASPMDFEEFGYRTMLECGDEQRAINICGLHLRAYEDQLQPEFSRVRAEALANKHRASALHAHLYDRPVPVSDAKMLSRSLQCRIVQIFTVLAAIACFVGNMTTFYLLGFGLTLTVFSAAGLTALPLIVGHLAYEWLVASHRWLQIFLVLLAVGLSFAGILKVAEARRDMIDKAASTPTASSYVDGGAPDSEAEQVPGSQDVSETHIHRSLGEGTLLIMIAAELVLGFLVGLLVRLHTDEDYAAWQKLKHLAEVLVTLETSISELFSSIEIAKKHCIAGILRAQSFRGKRRPPYHHVLTILVISALFADSSSAQSIERYEGILIDTSGSISRGEARNKLFDEYLASSKKVLLTEPPNSRVWILTISTDSFGEGEELLKGWTPDSRGIFTDNLNRARRQLANAFEAKSSILSPTAAGTDIFGGLWRLKALLDSKSSSDPSQSPFTVIWIFSDMVNETNDFPMPTLVEIGPDRMLERAKREGLLIPLVGYHIHVSGAAPRGMSPQTWRTIKSFWEKYFTASGAQLVRYSIGCDVQR